MTTPRWIDAGQRLGRSLVEAFGARWSIGLRASLSVGILLLAGVAAGRPSWGALASMGAFAGFYGPDTPYRHRIRLVAGIGAALAIVVPLASLSASHAWLSIVFVGAVAAIASFVCLACGCRRRGNTSSSWRRSPPPVSPSA
jgi:uncharacterized membrane protein YccC